MSCGSQHMRIARVGGHVGGVLRQVCSARAPLGRFRPTLKAVVLTLAPRHAGLRVSPSRTYS
eukprot:2285242-Prymnesium_polylepis.1